MCVKTDDGQISATDKDRRIFILEQEVVYLDNEIRRYQNALRRACKHLDSLGDGCEVCEHLGKCGLFENRDCIQGMYDFFMSDKKLPYEFSVMGVPKDE